MLDIRFIRENPEIVKKAVVDKQLEGTVDIDKLLEIEAKYRALLQKVEAHRNSKNELSNNIAKVEGEKREELIREATGVKEELNKMEDKLAPLKVKLDEMVLWVPNIPAGDVPIGKGEEDNVVARTEGKTPKFSFEPKDHLDLGTELGIIDMERGAKIGGFRNYFLKNKGLELHLALLRYSLDLIQSKGFDIFEVPWLVRPEYFVGTGYFPWGEKDHYITQDGKALIGTAEVSLTSYHANEVLEEEDLPVKMAAISPCYRTEVGSHGRDTKGIFRTHQFRKVEQVILLPEGEDLSVEWHEKMLGYSEELLKNLKLPYQVILMCTGDMGAGQRKKYDINTWFPSEKKYKETHSDSYFLDFQARRLNMKYKTEGGETKYVNTINNTVGASPRFLAAIIENYQQKDGSIKVPKVLQKYVSFKSI
ncbi:serine--tRNA ligase [Patescibacteria group bacterium]